jgi:hypothetical protein
MKRQRMYNAYSRQTCQDRRRLLKMKGWELPMCTILRVGVKDEKSEEIRHLESSTKNRYLFMRTRTKNGIWNLLLKNVNYSRRRVLPVVPCTVFRIQPTDRTRRVPASHITVQTDPTQQELPSPQE